MKYLNAEFVVTLVAMCIVITAGVYMYVHLNNGQVKVTTKRLAECVRVRTGDFLHGTFQIENCEGELITWEK